MKKLFLLTGLIALVLTACKKEWLEAKPDIKLALPGTLGDMQALLDNSLLHGGYPAVLLVISDDYYVTATDWASRSINDRKNYVWDKDAAYDYSWRGPYNMVLYSNVVLEALPSVQATGPAQDVKRNLEGSALFHRAYAYYYLAQLYCKPFVPATAATDPGLPLRLSGDINQKSVRASVQETYEQILKDLKGALPLLPLQPAYLTRPGKAAAYGALARTYLSMGQYAEAGRYADSSLQLQSALLDYNTLDPAAAAPFAVFNEEVMFHNTTTAGSILSPSRAKVDSSLYRSYAVNDLRRTLFFRNNNNGTYAFKGNYYGASSSIFFYGITTAEMYLTRAEAAAIDGQTAAAMEDLNTLLEKRWQAGAFTPLTAASPAEALRLVRTERRKELLFRGLRWSDLRRYNQESGYATTLVRQLDNERFELPPNDLRYQLLIPEEVIRLSGIAQNPR